MFAPHQPRRPFVLTGFAAGVVASFIASEGLDLPGLRGAWPLVLAGAAVLSTVVAVRLARVLPAADAAEDPFAFLDAVEADEPAPAPPRRRTWPIVRGFLATVGALTVLTGATVAAGPVLADPVRRLFGAHATCTLGARYAPADRDVRRSDSRKLDGHRTLKSFAEIPSGAGGSQ